MIDNVVKRAFFLIVRGFLGILQSPHLSVLQKFLLVSDYCRLILLTVQLPLRKQLTDKSIEKVFHIHALNLTIYFPNILAFFFLFTEIFCIQEYRVMYDLETYVDLGAYIGMSVLWYRYFNPKANIFAFEPNAQNYAYLVKNLRANHVRHCESYAIAVSDKTAKVPYYEILDDVQGLDSGLALNQQLPFTTSIVQTEKLSSHVKKIGKISLLKMDIEGSEYSVLNDLFTTHTLRNIQKIIFESHMFTPAHKRLHTDILRRLRKFGTVTTTANAKVTSIDTWTRAGIRRA